MSFSLRRIIQITLTVMCMSFIYFWIILKRGRTILIFPSDIIVIKINYYYIKRMANKNPTSKDNLRKIVVKL